MTATPSSPPADSDPSDSEGAVPSGTSTDGAFVVSERRAGSADAEAIRALRAQVYSRAGAASPTAEADQERLRQWESQVLLDDADARAARERADDLGLGDEGTGDEGVADDPRASGTHLPRHPLAVPVALSIAVALLVGGAVTRFATEVDPGGALAIFARSAAAEDSLPRSSRFVTLDGAEVAESRSLPGTYGWDLWAVRTDDASICLYAEREGATVSNCASPADFDRDGVVVTLPNSYAESSAYSTPSVGQPITLSWGPEDAALTFVPTD